jgi:hypothetical protein
MKLTIVLLVVLIAAACTPSTPQVSTPTTSPIPATVTSPTATSMPTITLTATETLTATAIYTATITPTSTVTATATFNFPTVTVNKQAHCRYGPSVAYLHAADLYAGDKGSVRGRFIYSNWLYVKFDKLNYSCWVAPSVVDVVGDISTVGYKELNLQSISSNQYGPPKNVTALRNGDQVTISWDRVEMSQDKDRGYLLELFVCQNGNYLWWTDSYPDQYSTSYTVKDEAGCSEPSSGKLYTVEKHGFSDPVEIPWPKP